MCCPSTSELLVQTRPDYPLFRRYRLDCVGEPRMRFWVNRPVLHLGTPWGLAKIVVAFPVLRWPDGSRHEATTAVRTHVVQDVVNTCGTERTLIGTDACLERIGSCCSVHRSV